MCNLSKGVEEKGIAKGRAEGIEETTLNLISNLMDTMNLPVEQAMSKLKIPEAEHKKYQALLKQ